MVKEKIEYLIKFVSQKEHAMALQDGILFMRPTCAFVKMYYDEYFKNYEKFENNIFEEYMKTYAGCIGDIRESLLYEYSMTRATTNIPVFCITYITSSQIIKNDFETKIVFNKKIIDEFIKSNYKYLIVVKYEEFINNINKFAEKFGGFGPMIYKERNTHETIKDCISNLGKGKNLFYKHPVFAYQQEFRIILNRAIARYNAITYEDAYRLYEYDLNDKVFKNSKELTSDSLPSFTEKIDSIKDYSKIYSVKDIKLDNEKYSLELK